MTKKPRSLQSHGNSSRVYVPIINEIFKNKYQPGSATVEFSLDDIREAALKLNIVVRNAGDVVYRMRARTRLPADILDLGFYILRAIGRGRYRLEQGDSTIIEIPDHSVTEALDLTPLAVRRLLPENLSEVDEQGLLTVINYCQLLNHFTGLTVYRLRSHVRKSVDGVGQAELDEIDVGVALRDDEIPVIFPIEAKAADEAINRVQISTMAGYSAQYFAGYEVRPLAIKLDHNSVIHFVEFNLTSTPSELRIVKSAGYKLNLSEQQRALFAQSQRIGKKSHSGIKI